MIYTDLHIHSEYTVGNGVTKIPDLIKRAKEFGMSALALTDSGSIAGFEEFRTCCENEGIKPIYGCGFYFAPKGLNRPETCHLVLLAKNLDGLNNLTHLSEYKRVDLQLIKEFSNGLICLSGGLGGFYDKPFLLGRVVLAQRTLDDLYYIFKEDLYLELQNNELEENKIMIKRLSVISKILKLPLVVSGGSFYLNREDSQECNRVRVSNGKKVLKGSGYYFKSPKEIDELFKEYPEAVENTNKILAKIEYKVENK